MDFEEFLKAWVEKINDINPGTGSDDFIILDRDYFPYDEEKGEYSINSEAIKHWKNAKMLFIADNPGEREKKHKQYLFSDDANYRSAGHKFHNLIQKTLQLSDCEVVKFNKCLISTSKTEYLKSKQIQKTTCAVCSFIKEFHKAFPDAFILFSGINGISNGKTKFKKLYKQLSPLLKDDNVGLMEHICHGIFPKELENGDYNITDFDTFKCLANKYKGQLFDNYSKDPADNPCDTCKFGEIYLWTDSDNDDDDGDDDGAAITSCVH